MHFCIFLERKVAISFSTKSFLRGREKVVKFLQYSKVEKELSRQKMIFFFPVNFPRLKRKKE